MLDVESCNPAASAQIIGSDRSKVMGRVVVEVIDAPWAGVQCGSSGISDWICRERPARSRLSLSRTSVCAPQGASGCSGDPLGDPTVALQGATISGLARQLGTTWNTDVVPYQADCKPHR